MPEIHTLVLVPYAADGSDIDRATNVVDSEIRARRMGRYDRYAFARGVDQFLDVVRNQPVLRVIVAGFNHTDPAMTQVRNRAKWSGASLTWEARR